MGDPNKRRPIAHLGGRKASAQNPIAAIERSLRKAMSSLEFPVRAAPTPKGQRSVRPPVGAEYDTAWARKLPARVLRRASRDAIAKPVVRYFARPVIKGLDRLDDLDGPALFAANHQSHADTAVMITSIPEPWCNRLLVAAAADYFFVNRVSSVMSALFVGAIPIERTAVNRKTIDLAVGLLRDGWSMVLYPEGGRSPDGWSQTFRPGAAYVAQRAGVPVVPVHIRGTYDILQKGRAWPKRARSVVNFGKPLSFEEGDNNRRFTAKMQDAVDALADETRSGNWFAVRRRHHTGENPPTTGPDAAAWRRRWALSDKGVRGSGTHGSSKKRWPYV